MQKRDPKVSLAQNRSTRRNSGPVEINARPMMMELLSPTPIEKYGCNWTISTTTDHKSPAFGKFPRQIIPYHNLPSIKEPRAMQKAKAMPRSVMIRLP
jgi:hypothetical protein